MPRAGPAVAQPPAVDRLRETAIPRSGDASSSARSEDRHAGSWPGTFPAVTPVPTLGDAPATADVLRDELTTNWQGALTTSDEDLETAVNAIRAALAA